MPLAKSVLLKKHCVSIRCFVFFGYGCSEMLCCLRFFGCLGVFFLCFLVLIVNDEKRTCSLEFYSEDTEKIFLFRVKVEKYFRKKVGTTNS